VIREYPEPGKKSSDNKSKTQELKPTEDTRSYDELLEQLNGLKSKQEQFIFACVNGSDEVSFELLKHLLEQSGTTTVKLDKIVDKQSGDASLLHLCAQRNKVACLELLTSHNLKVDILDKLQASPLIHAAALNCQDAATFLALKGANMNLKDDYNRFPLLAALKNKHYAMAETLAEQRGLDVDLRGTGGNTALHTMASEGDLQAAKILIENCKAVLLRRNNNENNVLMCALEHPDLVEYLCSKVTPQNLYKMAVHTNVDGRHAVHLCAANGWINSLLIIFKSLSSADLTKDDISTLLNERDKEEDTPLLLATKNNQVEIVKLLCKFQELRVNMGDFKGKTALTYALHSGKDKEIRKAIADAGGSLKNEEELAEKKRSPLTNYCLSMNNLLALLMVSFGFICILIIAGMYFFDPPLHHFLFHC
jgi:ankyrin repeat protein